MSATPGLPPGWSLRRVGTTGSTNADLLAAARAGAPHGSVLVADEQTAGRGRLGRTWVTPPGTALAVSVLLRPRVEPVLWSWLPLLAGLAVSDALAAAAPVVRTLLKWPNDVLVQGTDGTGRKLAGILAQQAVEIGAVVVGVGLNVTVPAGHFPPDADATSLLAAGAAGPALDRQRLLGILLGCLSGRYRQWEPAATRDDPSGGLAADYRDRCGTLGRPVRIEFAADGPAADLTGIATAIRVDGALLIQPAGAPPGAPAVAVHAGDVVHLRW